MDHTIKEYISSCEKCGKMFSQMVSEYHIQKGKVKKFCCRSCANSHTTLNVMREYKCTCCGKTLLMDHRSNPQNLKCPNCKAKTVEKTCVYCGKSFHPAVKPNGKLSKSNCCSEKCRTELKKINGVSAYKQAKEKGITKPWQSRNIISYPEKFWINVLNNNNIRFEREYFLNKKYFLDFYIEVSNVKIDLEIDGKQHTREDQILHDKFRDEYVTSNGIIVYRIPWNEINTDYGKSLMKEKIDDFLIFYNKLTG